MTIPRNRAPSDWVHFKACQISFTDECNDCGLCVGCCTYGALALEGGGK